MSSYVDTLINAGAIFDGPLFKGFSPLYVAARNNRLNVAERLLQERDIQVDWLGGDGSTPLYVAAQNGHPEMCQMLLSHGANPDASFLDGYQPLYISAQNGCKDVLVALSQYITDYNLIYPNGSTALYVAAQNGHKGCVEFLCQQGANVNIPYTGGYSPLYVAAQKGYNKIVQVLLDYNADIDFQTNRRATPLYVACQKGYNDVVRLLLECNANINIKFENGFTPLHIACSLYISEAKENYLNIINLLKDKGIDVHALSNDGRTALDIAIKNNNQNAMEALSEQMDTAIFMASDNDQLDVPHLLQNEAQINEEVNDRVGSGMHQFGLFGQPEAREDGFNSHGTCNKESDAKM